MTVKKMMSVWNIECTVTQFLIAESVLLIDVISFMKVVDRGMIMDDYVDINAAQCGVECVHSATSYMPEWQAA
jgi:hypothetical protein